MSRKSLLTIMVIVFSAHSQNNVLPSQKGIQQSVFAESNNQRISIIDKKPGEIVSVQVLKDGTTQVKKVDLTEMVDLIVEMKGTPLFLQQCDVSRIFLQKSAYVSRLMQFRSDMGKLYQSTVSSLKTTLGSPTVKREYYKIFVGAAVSVPRAMIPQLASLSYVKKVHADGKVAATSERGISQVQATSIHTAMKTQGDSIVVGIIDTGIDYQDTALGGGFGPGSRVIAGYDYVNNDANPMDDNGHGTHVAGIIAANDATLKGIAPHAKLMAFKVLNQNGSGYQSDVIAGIERATDPNNDGNFSNKADVVNMSLGGQGTPDDALSTAVDNAVQLGITFCIAAGNSNDFYTIGSPGTARRAITIGAMDTNNSVAWFSSKGPNPIIYSIKPEIVAPGVNILSTLPGNTIGKMSGTSMAAPYVAGVCALLKSLHREWTPAQIKSAVMTTALDLGQEVMAQGAGLVEASKAAEVSTLAIPSHISFGRDDFSPWWIVTDTLWVTNQLTENQSYSTTFINLKPGISITASPSLFSLSPGDSQRILMTLTVENAQIPSPRSGSLAYSGTCMLYGSKDTLRLPWAFIKAAKVGLAFDQPGAGFILAGASCQRNEMNVSWIDYEHAECAVPAGTYDLLTLYYASPMYLVFQEGLRMDSTMSVSVSIADAKYPVKLACVDQKGNPLSSSVNAQDNFMFTFPASDSSTNTFSMSLQNDSIFVSGFSDRFQMACNKTIFQSAQIYSISFGAVKGLQTELSLRNQTIDFHTQNLTVEFPPQLSYKGINVLSWVAISFAGGYGYIGGNVGPDVTGFPDNWHGTLFLNDGNGASNQFPCSVVAYDRADKLSRQEWIMSAPFRIVGDNIGMFYGSRNPASSYLSPDGGTTILGEGLHYVDLQIFNNILSRSNIYVQSNSYFYGALNEKKVTTPSRSSYKVYDDNYSVIASGMLTDCKPMDVRMGIYCLEVKHQDYYVQGIQGHATLTSWFNLGKSDANPPQLTSLRLLNARGLPVERLSAGEQATLIFSSHIYDGADIINVFYRKSGMLAWNMVPVYRWMVDTSRDFWSSPGYVYKADMTPATCFDSTGIDMKLVLSDQSGNSTEWLLEPAFGIGKFGTVDTVEQNQLLAPSQFALHQNYPNPFNSTTTIEFDIPVNSYVTLEVFNVLGKKISTLVAKKMYAGSYKIRWIANGTASGIYFCRLHAGSFSETKKLLLIK